MTAQPPEGAPERRCKFDYWTAASGQPWNDSWYCEVKESIHKHIWHHAFVTCSPEAASADEETKPCGVAKDRACAHDVPPPSRLGRSETKVCENCGAAVPDDAEKNP